MPERAFFGPPRDSFTRGGAHIAVYLVPVFKDRLVVFDIAAREARGRWLPWDVLDYGANPYEAASTLADDWCGTSMNDLVLADVLSFEGAGDSWEIAIVFRAELAEMPAGDDVRTPVPLEAGQFDSIGSFDPLDLERWVRRAPAVTTADAAPKAGGAGGLVF